MKSALSGSEAELIVPQIGDVKQLRGLYIEQSTVANARFSANPDMADVLATRAVHEMRGWIETRRKAGIV